MRTRRIVTAAAVGLATVGISLGAAGTAQAYPGYPWTTSAQCTSGGGMVTPHASFTGKIRYRCQGGLYSGDHIRTDYFGRPI